MRHFFLAIFATFCLFSCENDATTSNPETEKPKVDLSEKRIDHHSFARPQEAKTTHLDLDLKVNFDNKSLAGTAKWTIENNKANTIFFDAKKLDITKAEISDGITTKETKFSVSKALPLKGSAVNVSIEPSTKFVTLHYSTAPDDADALDWLAPEQTADKKHPALFTQGQAILTRSWIPCQDSPGIRITYDAQIEVPKDLMAVMSATNPQEKTADGIYNFTMKQPIPPYLLALAVGDLVFKPVGPRTGVYAEPSMIDKSVYEFADMEKMLEAAEGLYGKYDWERYDVIVLPPSFPFGGMENPRLTFATPTIIAGDRSLVSLIAHELAHSWSGNLVTNATWDDFWLNEGFTVYFERRIMEAVYGKDYVKMLAVLGFQDLEEDIAMLDAKDTHLKLNLKDRDPDDGMTDIAYEKGAFFLQMLEEAAGRDKFDNFLKTYFQEHKFQTIITEEFTDYLNKNLIKPNGLKVNINEWIYEPGVPTSMPKLGSDRFAKVDAEIAKYSAPEYYSPQKLEVRDWTTHEWLHFIRHLPKDMENKKVKALDLIFDLSDSGNSEILNAFFEYSIRNGYNHEIDDKICAFLCAVGRRKFLMPLYRAYVERGQINKAKRCYEKAKVGYHSVSRNSIEKLFAEAEEK